MKIINYETKYLNMIINLFYETVENINIKDYTLEQISVWINKNEDKSFWDNRFKNSITKLIIKDNIVIGFGNIDELGYIDMLYVHKDYQGVNVGTMLLNELESLVSVDSYTTDSSITARDFFIKHNYKIMKKQVINKNNILLTNYKMIKEGI